MILDSGSDERLKSAVHGICGGVALVCLTYNLAAWWYRRAPHLAVNVVVYGGLTLWEAQQVRRHWISATCPPRAISSDANKS